MATAFRILLGEVTTIALLLLVGFGWSRLSWGFSDANRVVLLAVSASSSSSWFVAKFINHLGDKQTFKNGSLKLTVSTVLFLVFFLVPTPPLSLCTFISVHVSNCASLGSNLLAPAAFTFETGSHLQNALITFSGASPSLQLRFCFPCSGAIHSPHLRRRLDGVARLTATKKYSGRIARASALGLTVPAR